MNSPFLLRFLFAASAVAVIAATVLSLPGQERAASERVAVESIAGTAQPIEFSHRIHAGENQIACSYCHTGAARSAVAGVPSVATCYECHRGVKLRNPGIEKVFAAQKSGQPIRWIRIHSLPDHVYFSHKRHTLGGVECQQCHGSIQAMDRVAQASELSMGWCLTCHEQRRASLECSTCHK
jgi:hypothetical protein